jgi:thiol-disulfide isomerase/thioredoxin
MKKLVRRTIPFVSFAVSVMLLSTGLLSASDAHDRPVPPEVSGELFLPVNDPVAAVANVMASARKSGKLVLVVMGANWCHDSRALASRLYQQPLKAIIEEHYEMVFIDVGFLDKGEEVISGFGPPVYYATPTVLIVEPDSGVLVNATNRHQWGGAFDISMEESTDYFQLMASADRTSLDSSATATGYLQSLLTEIDGFEQNQAARLYEAYAVIGPMLRAFKEGQMADDFEDRWNEVRDFRLKVPLDVDALRAEARDRVDAGEQGINLVFPKYPAFSWDQAAEG